MTIRTTQLTIPDMVDLRVRIARHPWAMQAALDVAFVAIALAIFGQVWDPDVLFHVIWLVLSLEAFLFGLRRTVARLAVAMLLLVAYFEVGATSTPRFLQLDLAEWPLMAVIALLVAVMADRVATTSRRYAELYRRASDRLITAQEDERARLGMDLHDGVGQTLTAMVLTLDAAESQLWAGSNPPSTLGRAGMQRAQELAAIALDETHEVAYRLRPARFAETGLVAAIKRLAATAGVPTVVTAEPELDRPDLLAPEDEMGVYRVIQEALSNAVRYSRASGIRVDMAHGGRSFVVTISDDGVGFDRGKVGDGGLGLAGMSERAAIMRGDLEIDTRPGGGTTVVLRVPLVVDVATPAPLARVTRPARPEATS
jgi:signal transduction histidine kinase